MPGFYAKGEYDIAGFIVGAVEEDRVLTGKGIREGDVLLGLGSTGLHTNGYSLARKILFERRGLGVRDPLPGVGSTVGAALLAVHRSYLGALRGLLATPIVRGLAHITGGGITDNLPRILPEGTAARIERGSWPIPPLFDLLRQWGEVPIEEMERTFNLGIGMIVVVPEAEAGRAAAHLAKEGETVHRIGRIIPGDRRVVYAGGGSTP
jgi:phosphoribosylformylglycinamidine cyclo-ligase